MSDTMTPVMWQLLEEAATTYHFASMDLRYDGGPYIGWLNDMVTLGYLDYWEDEHYGYSVSYRITDQGQQALAEHRRVHHIPAPPDDLSSVDFDWLAHLARGEYKQIPQDDRDMTFVVEALNKLAVKGYVAARTDAEIHHFALTDKGRQAAADQHFRLHGSNPA